MAASSFPKQEVAISLSKEYSKSEIAALSTQKNLSPEGYAMLFSHFKYSKELVINKIVSMFGRTKKQASYAVNRFIRQCKDNGIEINDIKKEQPEPKPPKISKKKPPKSEVENAVGKLAPVLDLFNVNKKGVIDAINSIDKSFSQEVILESYKALYLLLMAKARGDTVTKKVSASYVFIEQPDGSFKKELETRSDGKQKIWEETQSHLPDERAFAGALVVMEVIQNLEVGNAEYLTQEEQEDRYEMYLKKTEQQRLAYHNKEYTDAEILEEEEKN